LLALLFAVTVTTACKDYGKISASLAATHVAYLAETIQKDVDEVRQGLPQGAEVLGKEWKANPALDTDLNAAKEALETARRHVQELRIAKATFFALATLDGTVVRNDQEQDRMAGKALFGAFPELAQAKERYTETIGSLPEAAGVRAPRADGQWVAGAPVRVDGATRGLYVAGWAWTSYAYRLEFALRGKLRSELAARPNDNEPLVYVFIVVGKAAYGAPVTPEVSATTIAGLDPLAKVQGNDTFSQGLEITGRTYGLAVRRAPVLGSNVGVAVLRSET
jgi:hypothetical protein